MRERSLAPIFAIALIVCCGGSALAAGVIGGAALGAVTRFTPFALVGVGLLAVIAWGFDRRHHHGAPSNPPSGADQSTPGEGTPR